MGIQILNLIFILDSSRIQIQKIIGIRQINPYVFGFKNEERGFAHLWIIRYKLTLQVELCHI